MKKVLFLMIVMIGVVFTSCTSDDSSEEIVESSNLVINRSNKGEVILSLELSDEELIAQINEFKIANEASIEEGGYIEIKPILNKKRAIMSIKKYDIHDIEARIEVCTHRPNEESCSSWAIDKVIHDGCTLLTSGELFGYSWAVIDCP